MGRKAGRVWVKGMGMWGGGVVKRRAWVYMLQWGSSIWLPWPLLLLPCAPGVKLGTAGS